MLLSLWFIAQNDVTATVYQISFDQAVSQLRMQKDPTLTLKPNTETKINLLGTKNPRKTKKFHLLVFDEVSFYGSQNHLRLFLAQFMKGCHDHLSHFWLLVIGGINERQAKLCTIIKAVQYSLL